MQFDVEDMGVAGMLIGLIFILPVALVVRAVKFLIEPITLTP